MDAVEREAILATPLDTLTLPGYARGQLRRENEFRGNRSEEEQAVYLMKPLVTVSDWLSLSHSDQAHFGPKSFESIENACVALGVTREDAEQEDSDRFWSEHALGTKFERWCWEHEPLIRHLQEHPELVAELQARIMSPARSS